MKPLLILFYTIMCFGMLDIVIVFQVGFNDKPCLTSQKLVKITGEAVNVTLA